MSDAKPPKGLPCPRCGAGEWRVDATRRRPTGEVVRFRVCKRCGRRVQTVERIDVPKRKGER